MSAYALNEAKMSFIKREANKRSLHDLWKCFSFPQHLKIWQPLASSTSAVQWGCGQIINEHAPILFSNPQNAGWKKKQPCWKTIIHLSHHSWRFLTARSRKVQHRVVGVKQKPSLHRIRRQRPLPPEPPGLIHRTCPWKTHSCFLLQGSGAVNRKKCDCCCCSCSGDNLKSFDDRGNDILDILSIETEVHSSESARDRDSVCFFSHFVLFLGTVACLKAHTSSASSRPPELILIITMAWSQTPIPFSLLLCKVSKASHRCHVRQPGCSLLRGLLQ